MSKPRKKKAVKSTVKSNGIRTWVEEEIPPRAAATPVWTQGGPYPSLPDLDFYSHDDLTTFVARLLCSGDFENSDESEISLFEQQLLIEALKLVITIIGKNRDYGDSVSSPPVLRPDLGADIAMDVRLSDKLKRLVTLSKQNAHVKGESIDDTKLDIVGYILLQRTFRAMQKDEPGL